MGKPSLRELAYKIIHAAIVNGQLVKGAVTSEGELSRMLDMSRTPVRAALQQLELEGYIRIASKHGIIILDSSSRRTGNLLEMMISHVLFACHSAWDSDRERLRMLAADNAEQFPRSLGNGQENLKVLTDIEYQFLHDLVSLSGNDEMVKTFETSTMRLFWNQNQRRWQPPYTAETTESIDNLIEALGTDQAAVSSALFAYLRILKRTWH